MGILTDWEEPRHREADTRLRPLLPAWDVQRLLRVSATAHVHVCCKVGGRKRALPRDVHQGAKRASSLKRCIQKPQKMTTLLNKRRGWRCGQQQSCSKNYCNYDSPTMTFLADRIVSVLLVEKPRPQAISTKLGIVLGRFQKPRGSHLIRRLL